MNRKVIRLLEEDGEEMETGPASEIPDGVNTAQVEAVTVTPSTINEKWSRVSHLQERRPRRLG